jgi:IMP dehydrogenase/GMP reductase
MIKIDWNDISIIPDTLSSISSRSEINPLLNGNLPIFVSPMDTVVDENNYTKFIELGINVCLPRHIKYESLKDDRVFYSYGLDEVIDIFEKSNLLPKKVLIDVANGNMKKLWNFSKILKDKYGNNIELMVGNIANPETYRKYCEIGVDWIRVGVGGGSSCTTSANVSIHYPMASLVNECYSISKEFDNPAKILADGGFKSYSDIIKALALGSKSVMLGGIFNKCLESCSNSFIKANPKLGKSEYKQITKEEALEYFNEGGDIYKYYRGMSTKEVQKFWNKKELKTGEGITKYNKVEYTLSGWRNNFFDYLKSAMSYSGAKNLEEFIGEAQWVQISQMAFNRFNK